MTRRTRELMERVLKLRAEERAALAARFSDSLGELAADSVGVARAWREVLVRRYDDMVMGRDSVPA